MYNDVLSVIDQSLPVTSEKDIPKLFGDIPLHVFGELSLQEQKNFTNIKKFFPDMASEEVQKSWTGTHGRDLLRQSVSFIETVINFFKVKQGKEDLSDIKALDFGCGWGRLIRLLYKYVPASQIYGVDAWDLSLQICRDSGVRGNFDQIDYICKGIPFTEKFDLIYAFSVFTHLSLISANAALKAIRNSISEDGLLVITIRPFDYWQFHSQHWKQEMPPVEELVQTHVKKGFAFVPHRREQVDGDITYGDTSISIEYIQENWKDWMIMDVKINNVDPYQSIVFLKPV